MSSTTTAAVEHAVGSAANKYDRQLRLWGPHGQRRLAEAHVLLLKGSATGTETLKNLVLPGIGQFTVVDDAVVTEADLQSNFFVDASFVGKPRAEAVRELLVELNPDVRGVSLVRDPATIVDVPFLTANKFTLVVATQLPESVLATISRACWAANVPLIVARTYGLIGHVRLAVREHQVVESKQTSNPDLRVLEPFPQLTAYASAFQLDKLSDRELGEVPYVVLLLHALQAWRAAHAGAVPKSYDEKRAFRDSLAALRRPNPDVGFDNVDEAFKNAHLAYARKEPNGDVADVLAVAAERAAHTKEPFWILAAALAEFRDAHGGTLPLHATLPDMTASSQNYLGLLRAYHTKAADDAAAFGKLVDAVAKRVGKDPASISPDERATFAANAYGIASLSLRSVEHEIAPASVAKETVANAIAEDASDASPILFYLMWRACDQAWAASKSSYPGDAKRPKPWTDAELQAEAGALLARAKTLASDTYGLNPDVLTPAHALEMVRFGGVEVHNIAALVGGVASQEAVKLLTSQFVPMRNTFVYNGVSGVGGVWDL